MNEESTTACEFCGDQDIAPIVEVPGPLDPEPIEASQTEPADDDVLQGAEPNAPLSIDIPDADVAEYQPKLEEPYTEQAPLPAVGWETSAEPAPLTAASAHLEDSSILDSNTLDDDLVDRSDLALEEASRFGVTEKSREPSYPTPVMTAQHDGMHLGQRELMTGVLGVVGGAFVIFALLSTRGAASPGATSAAAQSSKPPAAPAAAALPAAVTPKWTSNPAAWIGNERHSAAFELASNNKVQVWMRQVQPMLVVRCRASVPEVFVFTNSPAKMEPQDENHSVRIRLDGNPEVAERWPDSAEHDALFAPDGGAFLQQLARAQKVEFGFSPHNANPVVATFNVTGLAEHLASAAKPCGWKATGGAH